MSKARLVVTAVLVEGRSPSEVARTYRVARSWVYELLRRHREHGDAGLTPRSRRPHHQPTATPDTVTETVIGLRRTLHAAGLDAGADTIVWHLAHHHDIHLSRATVYRILQRHQLITAEPAKKPRSAYVRFQAEQPNETWQADITHWTLTSGRDAEILTWLDDHARYALSVTAHQPVTGPIVVTTLQAAIATHGTPWSTLTDNGLVFTTRFAHGGRTSRNALENELARLGIRQKNSRPNHPTTCGKVERFQQTMKQWLRAQPPPTTLETLQGLLDRFVDHYNHHRPHRSLPNHATPAATYQARPKATPTTHTTTQQRVRHDRVHSGNVSLRLNGQLHHIAVGRNHDRTPVIVLIDHHDIRIIHATTGELLRALTINPERRYHGTGRPPGGPKGPRKNKRPEP